MPDPQLLPRLKKGVAVWNKWRVADPEEKVDLSEADLRGLDLSGVNLHRANLRGANLSDAYLAGADLSYAQLCGADLTRANLNAANLKRVLLSGARLRGARLMNANLTSAFLDGADLSDAALEAANFASAVMGQTVLESRNLHLAHGLETVSHVCPSQITDDTLSVIGESLPRRFLERMRTHEWTGTLYPPPGYKRDPERVILANFWLGGKQVQINQAQVNAVEQATGLTYPEAFFDELRILGVLHGTEGFGRAFTKARLLLSVEEIVAAQTGVPPNLLPFMIEEQSTWSDIYAFEVNDGEDERKVVVWSGHALVMDWKNISVFIQWMRQHIDKYEEEKGD